MNPVTGRIEQAPSCSVINLSDQEKELYSGAGWKLARFENGVLAGLFDPENVPGQEDVQAMIDEALDATVAWLGNCGGEAWLVMCSGYQLCDPRKINLSNAQDMAHLARIIGEMFVDE